MQVAINIETKAQVEVIAVNGGWSTVRDIGTGREYKLRNGYLKDHTTVEPKIVREYKIAKEAKAAKAPAAPKAPRAKMDINERKNGKVDPLYLPQYEVYSAVRKDGTKIRSIDKGDAIAVMLRGQDLATTYKDVAAATGTSIDELRDRFCHLNPGMQRMNLGNMLRRATR